MEATPLVEEATPLAEKQHHMRMVSGCFALPAEAASLMSLLTPGHPPTDLAHCTCRSIHACCNSNSNPNGESSLGDNPDACRAFFLILKVFDDLINGCLGAILLAALVSLQETRVKRDIIVSSTILL